jgi:hypothetical protein
MIAISAILQAIGCSVVPAAREGVRVKVVHDDDTVQFTDELAMDFMTLTAHRLNKALKANGIADQSVREDICASFLFDFAYHHDAGWLAHDEVRVYPMVAFAKRRPASGDEVLGAIDTLHVPTQASSWHEYATGVVADYFGESDESVGAIPAGSYERES